MHQTFDNLADKIAIHLNDTHPVLSIPEMMRLLIDEHKFSWMDAWMCAASVLLHQPHPGWAEALETRSSITLIGKILPRHLV